MNNIYIYVLIKFFFELKEKNIPMSGAYTYNIFTNIYFF